MELRRGTSGMIAVCVNKSGSSRCVFMVPPGSKRLFSPFLCHSDCRRSPAVGLSCHSQALWATTETLLTLAFILLLQTLNWIIKSLLWCATRSPLPAQGKQKQAYFEQWLKLSAYQVKTQNTLIILFGSGFRSTPLHKDYFWDILLSHWWKFDWRMFNGSYFFIFNFILDAGQYGSFWLLILGILCTILS